LQKRELVYSIGNLLALIGIVMLIVFTLLSIVSVEGLLRTGVNALSSLLLISGSVAPIILKEMEASQRLRSTGIRCFTASFIISIIMVLQMLIRGWASTVPVLASIALASMGIAAYLLSARGGRPILPSTREALLILSAVIVFATPMIQLYLSRFGLSADASRALSMGLLVVFAAVLYLSIKQPFKEVSAEGKKEGQTQS